MDVKFNMKGMIYGIFLIIFILAGFIILPKMFHEDVKAVDYIVVQRDDYIDQERALATIIDGKVYVIVTRGQNEEYGIDVEKINLQDKEGKQVMTVEAVYKQKEDAYPFVVLETNMKSLPDKIELNQKYSGENKTK